MMADFSSSFRMNRAHGVGPYAHLTGKECDQAAREAIKIARENISYGVAVTVEPKQFAALVPSFDQLGSPYTICARICLNGVSSWIRESGYNGEMAYFFESGHKSQSEANALMEKIFMVREIREKYRYASHTFADKAKVKALQAADLIAWHWHTDTKRSMKDPPLPPRKDGEALMSARNGPPEFHCLHLNEPLLRGLTNEALRLQYPATFVRM